VNPQFCTEKFAVTSLVTMKTTQNLVLGTALLLSSLCCWVHPSPLSNGHHDYHHHHPHHHDDHDDKDHGIHDHHHDHDGEHDHHHLMALPHSLAELLHGSQHSGHHGEYNPSVKPDGKVSVNITMYVRRLGRLCTHKNVLDLQLTYRETFVDQRLAGHIHPEGKDYVTLIGDDVAKIWTPDTFIRNSIESKVAGAIKPNAYARLYPDGKIKVSRRLDLKIACPGVKAQLQSGFDAVCPLGIASYGYEATNLEYFLNADDVMVGKSAASFLGQLDDKPIELSGLSTDSKMMTTNSGATYMSVKLNFNLNLKSS